MVIDCEYHLTPKERTGTSVDWKLRGVKFTQEFLDANLRDMDEAGIDRAVLEGGCRTLEESQILNDVIAEFVKECPDRFIGFVHTIPTAGEAALEELDRGVKDLGFKACRLMSNLNSGTEDSVKNTVLLNDPSLFPFYKKLVELDIPLFIHPPWFSLYPHAFPDPLRRKLKQTRSMTSGCGWEFDLMVATKLYVDGGVLDKFPNLKVEISHLGGGISAIATRLWGSGGGADYSNDEQRKAAEKSRKNFSKMYFNTAGHHSDIDALKFALTKISAKRIVFGTDYPYFGAKKIKQYIREIRNLDISDRDKQLILEENAASLLKV